MQPGDKMICLDRSNPGKCQLAGPLGDHGCATRGTMETATLAEFVGEARAAGWEPPRRGKLASLCKQLPEFEAACAALGRGAGSRLGDQLAAALTSSPAVSPP